MDAKSEGDSEILFLLTPTTQVVDLSILGKQFSDEEVFRKEVERLCKQKLPKFFPRIPDYDSAKEVGLITNIELRNSELTLPAKLLNSDTFSEWPELRGPAEEIIIGYDKERYKQGLVPIKVTGDSWSQHFRQRLEDVRKKEPGYSPFVNQRE